MRIAIDGRTIIAERSGVGTYAKRLIQSLLRIDKRNEYFLFLVEPNHELDAPNLSKFEIKGYNRMMLNRWWENILLPQFIHRHRIDLYFSPAYALPLLPRLGSLAKSLPLPPSWKPMFNIEGSVKFVVTVHDVIGDIFPETFTPKMRLWQSLFCSNAVRIADRILTDSMCTKGDLLRLYGGDERKISVLYPSIDENFRRVNNAALLREVRHRYSLPESFILSLGTIEPRKNIQGLAKAYSLLPVELRKKYRLVIGGALGWYSDKILSELRSLGISNSTQMLGYVEHEHLSSLYTLAAVFVFPSYYEGFGYPALEAMACGTPVITSDRSSLPEVGQGAGLMVDPDNHHELAATIQRLISNKALQKRMQRLGYSRVNKFGWQKTARQTLSIFEETLAAKPQAP